MSYETHIKRVPHLSPIQLATELRNMQTMQRMRPSDDRAVYIIILENEQRVRDHGGSSHVVASR